MKKYIIEHKLFTSAVAEYIHTFKELDYYTEHNYHEVRWNGRPALIIDVNPDYRCTRDQKTNRERMLAGEAAVVPSRNKEEYKYHIHHVGQTVNSPYVIIPEYDHNSEDLSSVLHPRTPIEDLHDSKFNSERKQFWRTYIAEYDRNRGGYDKIPYLNPRRKRKEKS